LGVGVFLWAKKISSRDATLRRLTNSEARYYVVNVQAGDVLTYKVYARVLGDQGVGNFDIKITEPDDARLARLGKYVISCTEWERYSFAVAAKQTGPHLMVVYGNASVEYKMTISGEVREVP